MKPFSMLIKIKISSFFVDEESVKVPYDELKYAIDPLFFDSLKKE